MKSFITTALIAVTLMLGLQLAHAADVSGSVKTNVKTGVILQSNKGIANKNSASLGSVSGKTTSVGGDVKMNVKTGAVIQSNKGIANKNEVALGSVTD